MKKHVRKTRPAQDLVTQDNMNTVLPNSRWLNVTWEIVEAIRSLYFEKPPSDHPDDAELPHHIAIIKDLMPILDQYHRIEIVNTYTCLGILAVAMSEEVTDQLFARGSYSSDNYRSDMNIYVIGCGENYYRDIARRKIPVPDRWPQSPYVPSRLLDYYYPGT